MRTILPLSQTSFIKFQLRFALHSGTAAAAAAATTTTTTGRC